MSEQWNPRNLPLLKQAFAERTQRSALDRLLSVIVVWLLARGWLRWKLVPTPEGGVYMLRVYLSPGGTAKNPHRWFAVFLHYLFVPDDPSRGLHSHPYPWFASLILTAGYRETRGIEDEGGDPDLIEEWYVPGMVNVLTGKTYHRITEVFGQGVWSLFVCGPRHKDQPGWGFIGLDGRKREAKPDGHEGIAGDKYQADPNRDYWVEGQ